MVLEWLSPRSAADAWKFESIVVILTANLDWSFDVHSQPVKNSTSPWYGRSFLFDLPLPWPSTSHRDSLSTMLALICAHRSSHTASSMSHCQERLMWEVYQFSSPQTMRIGWLIILSTQKSFNLSHPGNKFALLPLSSVLSIFPQLILLSLCYYNCYYNLLLNFFFNIPFHHVERSSLQLFLCSADWLDLQCTRWFQVRLQGIVTGQCLPCDDELWTQD
jgi:hypothetical protein